MTRTVTEADARASLAAVEQGRRHVIDQIDMPRWYWWGLAVGWIGLAVINDLDRAWLALAATLVFGAVHAAGFNFVAAGRRRTRRLSVRADTAGWYAPLAVLACLVGLGAVTVLGALLASADGAGRPVTLASVPVAVAIVLGGPRLMAAIRRRASRPQRVRA
jgi:hypothetical protein